jgi:hypothetical protein
MLPLVIVEDLYIVEEDTLASRSAVPPARCQKLDLKRAGETLLQGRVVEATALSAHACLHALSLPPPWVSAICSMVGRAYLRTAGKITMSLDASCANLVGRLHAVLQAAPAM